MHKYNKLVAILLLLIIIFTCTIQKPIYAVAVPAYYVVLAALATAGGIEFATEQDAEAWAKDVYEKAGDKKNEIITWTTSAALVSKGTLNYITDQIHGTHGVMDLTDNIIYPGSTFNNQTFIIPDNDTYIMNLTINDGFYNNNSTHTITGYISYMKNEDSEVNNYQQILGCGISHFNLDGILKNYLYITTFGSNYIYREEIPDGELSKAVFPYNVSIKCDRYPTGYYFSYYLNGSLVYVSELMSEYAINYYNYGFMKKVQANNCSGSYTKEIVEGKIITEGVDYTTNNDLLEQIKKLGLITGSGGLALILSQAGVDDMADVVSTPPSDLNNDINEQAAAAAAGTIVLPDVPAENVNATTNQWLQKLTLDTRGIINAILGLPSAIATALSSILNSILSAINSISKAIAAEIERLFVPSANYFPNWFNQLQGAILLPSFDEIFDFNYIEKDISWMVTIGGYSILPEITFQLIPDVILEQRNWIRTITGAWIVFVTGIFAVRKVARLINS